MQQAKELRRKMIDRKLKPPSWIREKQRSRSVIGLVLSWHHAEQGRYYAALDPVQCPLDRFANRDALDALAKRRQKKLSDSPAQLPAWMNDRSLLPLKPPTRKQTHDTIADESRPAAA